MVSTGTMAALDRASLLCDQRGTKLTALRRQVLGLILESEAPIGAYDLLDRLRADRKAAAPPTVYRALEFLERVGFAHRIESLNAYVACRRKGGHSAAFLICDCCGAAEEFEPDFAPGRAAAAAKGYAVTSVTLDARGLCPACPAG